jgi:hypothetical protein
MTYNLTTTHQLILFNCSQADIIVFDIIGELIDHAHPILWQDCVCVRCLAREEEVAVLVAYVSIFCGVVY